MTPEQRISYKILKFLADPNVRGDSNITDGAIVDKLYDEDKIAVHASIMALENMRAIDKTSFTKQWQITQVGETELERLQTIADLHKNIEATKVNFKTTQWVALSTMCVSALGVLAVIAQCYFAKEANDIQRKLLQQNSLNSISSAPLTGDLPKGKIYKDVSLSKDTLNLK